MRLNGKYLLLAALLPTLVSCGLLGPKDDPAKNLDLSVMTGCLNSISDDLPAYLVGEVDEKKWAAGFDCTRTLLRLFQRYTGTERTFSPEEMRSFVEMQLVTNASVSLELVQAAFELKASLLGGSKELVTSQELTSFSEILEVLKVETTAMIPYFRYRAKQPSPARMLELSRALEAAMYRISRAFDGRGSMPFSRRAMETLVTEASKTFRIQIPDNSASTFLAIKAILFSGDADSIEPDTWVRVLQTAGTLGGPLLAAASVEKTGLIRPNELGEFVHQLILDVRPLLDRGISAHGGAVDLALVDALIDTFTHGLHFGKNTVASANAKSTVDILFTKLFKSARPRTIDTQVLDSIMEVYDRWRRGQTHLETIFRYQGLNTDSVSGQLFSNTARNYAVGLDMVGQADVNRLIQLASRYRPMFYADESEMAFRPTLQHSMGNIAKLHWMSLVAELGIKTYGSDPGLHKLSSADWATLFADFIPIGADLGAIDLAVPRFAERRFREVDTFTFASDGDGFLDADEITYYLATIVSLMTTMERVREDIEPICALGPNLDGMKWKYMDPACYRREFYARADKWWDHEPVLYQQYLQLSDSDKALFQLNTEKTARLRGHNDNTPMGGYDASGFILVMLLQEEFFARWDVNQDGWLNTQEAISSSPPTARFAANRGGIDINQTAILEAIQTFALHKGRAPEKDVAGILELGAWIVQRPFWNLHVTRPDAYKSTCIFSDFDDGDKCR